MVYEDKSKQAAREFADKITRVRESKGLRQRDVAESISAGQQLVSNIENAVGDSRLSTYFKFAEFYGLELKFELVVPENLPPAKESIRSKFQPRKKPHKREKVPEICGIQNPDGTFYQVCARSPHRGGLHRDLAGTEWEWTAPTHDLCGARSNVSMFPCFLEKEHDGLHRNKVKKEW